ncbi:AraC family transcriptional regulator [Azospirillum palustre]
MRVDPLAEVVSLLKPAARFSKFVECAGSWRIRREGTGEPFYCAILEGKCRMMVNGHTPAVLEAGDFVMVPAMQEFINESPVPPPPGVFERPAEIGPGQFRAGQFRTGCAEGSPDLRMQVGHCVFDSPDAPLLVPLLPRTVIVRGEPRLLTVMQLVSDESQARRSARDLVLERLLEVLLIETFRCAGSVEGAPGLARGLADPRLADALGAMHAEPGRSWTVAELAAEAGMSRSAFFARFDRVVGVAPMEYLLSWRMALAKQLLRDSEFGVEEVAERVGYSSANTFTVAFTRFQGVSPARYSRSPGTGESPASAKDWR